MLKDYHIEEDPSYAGESLLRRGNFTLQVGAASASRYGDGKKLMYYAAYALDNEPLLREVFNGDMIFMDEKKSDAEEEQETYLANFCDALVRSTWLPVAAGSSMEEALTNLHKKVTTPYFVQHMNHLQFLIREVFKQMKCYRLQDNYELDPKLVMLTSDGKERTDRRKGPVKVQIVSQETLDAVQALQDDKELEYRQDQISDLTMKIMFVIHDSRWLRLTPEDQRFYETCMYPPKLDLSTPEKAYEIKQRLDNILAELRTKVAAAKR